MAIPHKVALPAKATRSALWGLFYLCGKTFNGNSLENILGACFLWQAGQEDEKEEKMTLHV